MNQEKATAHARQEVEKFVVRLPKGMRARIAEVSRLSHRSMNSEIIARLEESLGQGNASRTTTSAPLLRAVDTSNDANLVQLEREVINRFRALSADKRAALLELIR